MGRYFDILVDSGGANQPAWGGPSDGDPRLWRAPVDPGGTVVPPLSTCITPPATAPAVDFSPVKQWIDALAADENAHAAEGRDRDERIYADEKAIAESHYQQLTTQLSNIGQGFAPQQRGSLSPSVPPVSSLLEAVVGLIGAFIVLSR